YAAFSGAESIGSHFYRNIKPDTDRYPFQRINENKDGE
ncbi:TPA: KTSC domain-containing protein, partial [Yersinia enterocolitica]|nr:KTSC domain-containing protein [Yersinia enterocolitica]